MGPVKLRVSTRQQEYFPGDIIEGTVDVEVCTVSLHSNEETTLSLLYVHSTGMVFVGVRV